MIEVIEAGALTSVQTAAGRPGWRYLGVPVGGAADAWSARLANRLIGNVDDAPLLEITLLGPTLLFTEQATVAVTGAPFDASIDGMPLPWVTGRTVRAGALLRFGSGEGSRAYLAIGGGIVVEELLGSAATDLRNGFGGLDGRALRPSDRLTIGPPSTRLRRWTGTPPTGPIRIVDGPQSNSLSASELTDRPWSVAVASDRTGVRLDGPPLMAAAAEVESMGLPLGAIQVPPDGRPIVLLADRPVTGGYPVPACVIRADIGRVARLLPGDAVAFASVSVEEARAADRFDEEALDTLEDAVTGDDELGWTGALE